MRRGHVVSPGSTLLSLLPVVPDRADGVHGLWIGGGCVGDDAGALPRGRITGG